MHLLETAMNSGHLGARYAIGMILLLQGGVHKNNGMHMILSLKKSTITADLEEIRKVFLDMIKGMWIRNAMIMGQEMPQCCPKHKTDSIAWAGVNEVHLHCENCSCDQELLCLWSVLPNRV